VVYLGRRKDDLFFVQEVRLFVLDDKVVLLKMAEEQAVLYFLLDM